MVNRSVAKRAKHAKPALRKGYWAKSSSSVLAVALAASLVPAVPALGDEFDADVSDIEATEPPAFDAPIPTEPSSTAPDALAELEAGDRATSVDSKSDAGNKGALPESGGAEGVGDRTFGEVDDAGFREGLGAEALAAAEVQEESSGQGSSMTWVPALERQAARRRLGPHRTGPPPILWAGSGLRFPVPRPLASMCRFTRGVLTGPR